MSNERVVCAACGMNNFATQAACWKCGKPLAAGVPLAQPVPASPSTGATAVAPPRALASESPVAFWSSVVMGIIFPMIALPVGLVFLMLDDRRKAQIGWWNILFGLVGSVLNGIVVAVSLAPLLMSASRLVPGLGGLGSRGAAAQSQDLNSEAQPLELPGQRPFANPPR
jgi:hypothetical protein